MRAQDLYRQLHQLLSTLVKSVKDIYPLFVEPFPFYGTWLLIARYKVNCLTAFN